MKRDDRIVQPLASIDLLPAARIALEQLNRQGYQAYLVGGCVRDALMRRTPKDWDITTDATPTQVKRVFSNRHIIETGLAHATLTVRINGESLEITTFRGDASGTDASNTLATDLAHRDFTVNAMAYHPSEGLIDAFGGVNDLARRCLRCVGSADDRFAEDPLRTLRALRFAAQYDMTLDPETAAALRRAQPQLATVAAERIQSELTRLLCGAYAAPILCEYADTLAVPLPEIASLWRDAASPANAAAWRHTVETVRRVFPLPALKWAALLHDIGESVAHSAAMTDRIAHRLRFDTETRRRMRRLVEAHDTPIPLEDSAILRALCDVGEADFRALAALRCADAAITPEAHDALLARMTALLQSGACYRVSDLAVNGHDLQANGIEDRAIGQSLRRLLNAVMDGRCPNERASLLAYLHRSPMSSYQ